MRAEVLVIGAGPAGATAALNLAPFRQVVIADMQAVPALRIGESLPPAARRLLTDMGLFEAFQCECHLAAYANRARWGGDTLFENDFLRGPDGNGWHLDRRRFEQWLREIAVERGATLLAPARLEGLDRSGGQWIATLSLADRPIRERFLKVTAGFLIDAGGRAAPIARRLGGIGQRLDRLICVWTHGTSKVTGEGAGLSYVESAEDGWWYTAPLPQGLRVLAFHTDADLPAARRIGNREVLMERAASAPGLASLLANAEFLPYGRCGVTPANGCALHPCSGPAWLAAGDAALSFDPLSAQGLLNALYTGLAAAESTDSHLSGRPEAVAAYAETLKGIHKAYTQQLAYWYGQERRWPEAPFWRRRH